MWFLNQKTMVGKNVHDFLIVTLTPNITTKRPVTTHEEIAHNSSPKMDIKFCIKSKKKEWKNFFCI